MLNNLNSLFIDGKEVTDAFINGKQIYPPSFTLTYVYNNDYFHLDMVGLTYNGSPLTTATKGVRVGDTFTAGDISTGITYSLAKGWFAAGEHPVHVVGWYTDAGCTTQITEGTVLDGSVKTVYAKLKADYSAYDTTETFGTVGKRRSGRSSVMNGTTFKLPTILNAVKVYLIGGGGACGQAQGADPDGDGEGVEVAMTQPGSYGGSDISEYTLIGTDDDYSIALWLGAGGQGGVAPAGSSYIIRLGGIRTDKTVAGGTNGSSNKVHINCGDSDTGEVAISRGYSTVGQCVFFYGDTDPDVDNYSRRYNPKGGAPYNRFWFSRGSSWSSGRYRSGRYIKLNGTRTEKHPWNTSATTFTVSLQTNAITAKYEDVEDVRYYVTCVDSDSQGNLSFGQETGYGYAGIGGLARSTSGSQTYGFVNGQPGGCQIVWY